jgi:hypothetical protein
VAQPEQHQPQSVQQQQPQQQTAYTYPSMRSTFSNIVHEAMDQGNKDRVHSTLQNFDDDAIKAQGLMAQAYDVKATTHKDCISTIRQFFNDIRTGTENTPQNDETTTDVTARSPSRS